MLFGNFNILKNIPKKRHVIFGNKFNQKSDKMNNFHFFGNFLHQKLAQIKKCN